MNRSAIACALASLVFSASCHNSTTTTTPTGKKDPVNMDTEAVVVGGNVGDAPPNPDALPLWPEIKKGRLANGLTYYILPHKKPEKRAYLWLAVNAGSMIEDDDQRGLAHFDEHMAFNGTKNFPKNDLIKYLESIGMRFGADLNAYTNFDETVYQLEVPTDDPKFVSKGFDILHDWAGETTYDPVEVDKERGVVTEEWRLGRGAGRRLYDKQSKVLFAGSRYGTRDTIGDPEILAKAPRDTLYRFYKDWYRPDLMAVIAVGDFDPAAIEKEITAKFGALAKPATSRKKPVAGIPDAKGTRVSIETDKEATSQNISIENLFAHRPEATKADLRRIVLETVYTQVINERLQSLGRKQESPFTMAFASAGSQTREIDGFSRDAQVKNGKVEDALRALLTEVVRIDKFGLTQTELDRAKARLQQSYEQSVAQEATADGRQFTREITRNFLEGEFMIGALEEARLSLEVLPTITKADLDALAKTYGGADNRVVLLSGPDGKPMPTKDAVLKIIDDVGKSDLKPWEDKAATAQLLDKAPKPGTVTKETKTDSLGVTEWTLSNGAKVIVKPTDFENDQIVFGGVSPGGLTLASNKDYPDVRFASAVVAIGGLGEFDSETLGKMLAGKRANANFSIGETTENVSGSASQKDLETMFQLVYLGFTAPRKDDDMIATWRQNSAERMQNQLVNPETQFSRQVTSAMFQNNLRRKPLEPGDYKAANLDKALAFYKERFADASDFTFVIVGTVDLAKLKPLVETYLASLPTVKRKVKDVEKDPGIKRAPGVVKKEIKLGQEPKARVELIFHGEEKWTRDLDRDMTILSRVLGIKLRETLREDMGGVYGVGAGGGVQRLPRHERAFSISFGCAPDKVEPLVKASFEQIEKLATDGIKAGDDTLDKVKATFLRERETALKQNNTWLGWLLESARYNDDATIILDPSKMVARMTSDNVKASAKRFTDKKQYFESVLLPATTPATTPTTPATPPAKK